MKAIATLFSCALLFVGLFAACAPKGLPPEASNVDYTVAKSSTEEGLKLEWVVVRPEDATPEKLKTLAQRFAASSEGWDTAITWVFDDRRAVDIKPATATHEEKKQLDLYTAHWKALYFKNLPVYHGMEIYLGAQSGDVLEVQLAK